MRFLNTITLTAVLSLAATALSAQGANPTPTRNVPASLAAKAKISEDSARAVALKRVPGTVETVHLMEKSGKLEYVFGIKPTGKNGMEKVTVNAASGHLISVTAAGSTKPKSTTPHSS
jgi:uncharacterized membrane protein YkoI